MHDAHELERLYGFSILLCIDSIEKDRQIVRRRVIEDAGEEGNALVRDKFESAAKCFGYNSPLLLERAWKGRECEESPWPLSTMYTSGERRSRCCAITDANIRLFLSWP